jgi:Acyl-CoA thioesterase C-terminal domain
VLHRDPVGEWLGSQAVGYWPPDGVGVADALLLDDRGPVGRAVQTLLLRRPPTAGTDLGAHSSTSGAQRAQMA